MDTAKNVELPQQQLSGTIERITFQNEENGYTVARLIPKGKNYEVTVVGTLAGVNVGEFVLLKGTWMTHTRFGKQFEVHFHQVRLPATIEGIRKYLGSGLVKGVGPVTAAGIVDFFGLDTLEVIETVPHRLKEVPGIGEKRTRQISEAWVEQKQIKELMIFLQGYGVSPSLGVKIYKQYGNESMEVVRKEPYRLAKDIFGVGFKTADKVARQMGLAADSPQRIQAGLIYAISQLSDDGHCYATQPQLLAEAEKLLEVPTPVCQEQIAALVKNEDLMQEEDRFYLPPFYYAEIGAANRLQRLRNAPQDRLSLFKGMDWEKAYEWIDQHSPIQLTGQQKSAVRMGLTEKVSILTGGPGTGKSTITRSILQLVHSRGGRMLLCAPTGRAAKRLSEATGMEAKTIHRLLEYAPMNDTPFKRNEQRPLEGDLIIVDEVSMIDILLFNRLLSAVDSGSHLLLVGDVDQLPSVGAGNVLRDLIDSKTIPVTRLETIFRQAKESFIIVNAHRINQGEMPLFDKTASDFFLFPEEDAEKAADRVIDLVTSRIPQRFGCEPQADIQVLCPMHRGAAGVGELNHRLQAALNPVAPAKTEIQHGSRLFRSGDRVMQIRNDYERSVFNGDMGRILTVDLEEQTVLVDFEDHRVTCEFVQLDELVHAYAVSIHKSQGSEYPVVVVPLLTQHYMMLQRNLLYTAVTRARKLVVLVGSRKAIAMAVRNNRIDQRNTHLAERLSEGS